VKVDIVDDLGDKADDCLSLLEGIYTLSTGGENTVETPVAKQDFASRKTLIFWSMMSVKPKGFT